MAFLYEIRSFDNAVLERTSGCPAVRACCNGDREVIVLAAPAYLGSLTVVPFASFI